MPFGRIHSEEADVSFVVDADHGPVVIKRYRCEVDCIRWLNQHLAKFYDPANGLPVAQHEFAALQFLEPYGFVPKPMRCLADAIVMAYAGRPLSAWSDISFHSYLTQSRNILETFKAIGFRHNDLLVRNVLVYQQRVHIIDFTLAEFGDIALMDQLPNSGWARPGQDAQLLTYLSEGSLARRYRFWQGLMRLGRPRHPIGAVSLFDRK